ncbi:DUF4124 domain-containing protein [Vibrio sp. AND4]|uniref:DUF4124 domain-containing protein n=1 Tax=Vibrio sp. AND4 TaxID=314289 RepID=UPI00015F2CD5|nr:DUF4124 domain-containing protein [Vibrio sp. AND4]EDP58839.1 nitrogen regulation protein NR(II) [Vibrio sp. AND4]
MKVQLLLSLCACNGFLIATAPSAQVAYTWIDKDGVVHFSDTPSHDAKTISLPNLKTSVPTPRVASAQPSAPQASAESKLQINDKPEAKKPGPLSLTILNPQHDETIRSNLGAINIQLDANRKLGIGVQLQLLINGQPYGPPQNRLTWQLKNIDRGTHTLSVQAKRSGKLIASTNSIAVHLHRASIKSGVQRAKQNIE